MHTTRTSLSSSSLQSGLDAQAMDARLRDARRRRDTASHELAFYLCEMDLTRRYQALGFRSLGQYGEERLGMSERRVYEFARAGKELRRLTRVARACEEGRIGWTKTELLTHGIQAAEQDVWIERARTCSCAELRGMLRRYQAGLAVVPEGEGGLPMPGFTLVARLSVGQERKLEEIRRYLMKQRGRRVADEEIVGLLLEGFEVPAEPEVDEEAERLRLTAVEQDATPGWLRDQVKLRDGFRCQACGCESDLHVHHIKFRCHGGKTKPANLITVCAVCHGLIHAAVLFVDASRRVHRPAVTATASGSVRESTDAVGHAGGFSVESSIATAPGMVVRMLAPRS